MIHPGGRYNPNTNSWIATSTTNAPASRSGAKAVWTGSEMIVWGGFAFVGPGFIYFDTGGRYNPNTNSWTATSTTNAPDGRTGHTAVWTGSEMIVWGGHGDFDYWDIISIPVDDTIPAPTAGQLPAQSTRRMVDIVTRQYGPATK